MTMYKIAPSRKRYIISVVFIYLHHLHTRDHIIGKHSLSP